MNNISLNKLSMDKLSLSNLSLNKISQNTRYRCTNYPWKCVSCRLPSLPPLPTPATSSGTDSSHTVKKIEKVRKDLGKIMNMKEYLRIWPNFVSFPYLMEVLKVAFYLNMHTKPFLKNSADCKYGTKMLCICFLDAIAHWRDGVCLWVILRNFTYSLTTSGLWIFVNT
jgi:hypothetical protein